MSWKGMMSVSQILFFLVCGLFQILLFPGFNLGFLAWFAFVPLFLLVRTSTRAQALCGGWIFGFVFFAGSLYWLMHVTAAGWLVFSGFEAIWMMLFVWLSYEGFRIQPYGFRMLWLASSWLVIEFLRSEIPVFGFPWNLLAASQTTYPWFVQPANLIGAYGVGFVIVLVNAMFTQALEDFWHLKNLHYFSSRRVRRSGRYLIKRPLLNLVLLGAVMIGYLSYCQFSFSRQVPQDAPSLKVSVLQGNIPQDLKWSQAAKENILKTYFKLTRRAGLESTDLIVWPEAAFPGYLNKDIDAEQVLNLARELAVPLLVGSPHNEDSLRVYNSAYLVSAKGEIAKRYDKQYLVPFGEYIPLRPIFGWLEPMADDLGIGDFFAGKDATVFYTDKGRVPFSVPICFEDAFPNLIRKFVEKGARLLVVITNDAWFGKTSAAAQHLQASILRAVENGVPIVRAANTGISSFVSLKGRVTSQLTNEMGEPLFVEGHQTQTVSLEDIPTPYRMGGYLFPFAMMFLFVFIVFSFRAPHFLKRRHSL